LLTRRDFLLGTTICGATSLCGNATAFAQFEPPLPIPSLIDAKANGGTVTLTAARGRHAFFPGEAVTSYGLSAPVLGPVVRLRRRETARITVANALDRQTTLHWHGLIVPGEVDGGPHNVIEPSDR
jgi:blue copper oxidase